MSGRSSRSSRRNFIKGVATGAAISTVGVRGILGNVAPERLRDDGQVAGVRWEPVFSAPRDVTRPWLGAGLWANRLQDWR